MPFRSVANRLLKGLTGRPGCAAPGCAAPTDLRTVELESRKAKTQNEPYHVVHFDGHGTYGEAGGEDGAHGHPLFENPALDDNHELVDGPRLGSLLG